MLKIPVVKYRFLLVISPAPELSAMVSRVKTALAEKVGSFSGRHSIPHITLFLADLPGECERDICEGVAAGIVGHKAFTLHYEGITHFEDRKTIFVHPVEQELIAPIRRSIVQHVRSFPRMKGIKPTDRAHLTIAAGLRPGQFDKAWEMLAPHELYSEERVTEVVLLKRLFHPGTVYEPVRSFSLG